MINVRLAEVTDIGSIIPLIKNELGYSDLDETYLISRLNEILKREDFVTFVASKDDKTAGFIGAQKGISYVTPGFDTVIMVLAVNKQYMRMGIGRALVKAVEDWSVKQGIKKISLSSNLVRTGAHAFYENCGYTKSSYKFKKNMEG